MWYDIKLPKGQARQYMKYDVNALMKIMVWPRSSNNLQ